MPGYIMEMGQPAPFKGKTDDGIGVRGAGVSTNGSADSTLPEDTGENFLITEAGFTTGAWLTLGKGSTNNYYQ